MITLQMHEVQSYINHYVTDIHHTPGLKSRQCGWQNICVLWLLRPVSDVYRWLAQLSWVIC